ncbi:MAG: GTP-binding protein, partial [Alcanivoracaceae bacterium]|nr:GTP-binding protein [Alcanivoracaceae bacterium]
MKYNPGYQQALKRIQQEKEHKTKTLDLTDLGLIEIPEEVSELIWIEQLYLNNSETSFTPNQISSIPEFIYKSLPNLIKLKLTRNKLDEISPLIKQLTHLKEITLYENKFKNLKKVLDNVKNIDLVQLSLSEENLEDDFKDLKAINKLGVEFKGSKTGELPKIIFDLDNITHLWIRDNKLSQLPTKLVNLKQLHTLSLANNQLIALPKELEKLTQLKIIDISNNQFETFPPSILVLSSLEELWMPDNKVKLLPKEINNLKRLQKLYIRNNQLKALPAEVGELTQLKIIDISDNQFEIFPPCIIKLSSLEELWMYDNKVKLIPKEINNLKRLQKLYIRNNQLKALPIEIEELTQLKVIEISGNKFETFPPSIIKLSSLEELRMLNNEIKQIPKEIINLKKLQNLYLSGNPIKNIPKEIYSANNVDEIFNYLHSIDTAEEKEYIYEAKMAIVGRGKVGKTSLCRKLTIPNYQLEKKIDSTESIDIHTLDLPIMLKHSTHFRLNLWDFAGQEKYDATHQYFITKRSLYLFVTEARQESSLEDFDYWLNIITLLSDNSPIIVVQNKIDERHKQLPSYEYQKRFPNILSFIDISCHSNYEHTIKSLKDWIKKGIRKLPQVGDKLPKAWVDIRREIELLSQTKDILSYQTYENLCAKHGLN